MVEIWSQPFCLIEYTVYRANTAQSNYSRKVSNRQCLLKIGKDKALEEYIHKMILKDKRSLDAVIGEIKRKGYSGYVWKIRGAEALKRGSGLVEIRSQPFCCRTAREMVLEATNNRIGILSWMLSQYELQFTKGK